MRPRLFSYILVTVAMGCLYGQIVGRNVNMVSGTKWPDGDPFLQRQNEPTIAVSTRNTQHLLAGANDYRTVDLPGLPDGSETGDAWLGLFKSLDGGVTWRSTLLPGCRQKVGACEGAEELRSYDAGADPVIRAGTHGLFYYSGIAFQRDEKGKSLTFVARYIDNNNAESGDPFQYLGTTVVQRTDVGLVDKPWIATDIPREGAGTCSLPGKQSIPAGNVYMAYTMFADRSEGYGYMQFMRSTDCGATWSNAINISDYARNQGANVAVDPKTGTIYVVWRRFKDPNGLTDALLLVTSTDFGATFSAPAEIAQINPFDQATSSYSFRTNSYPTAALDETGRYYVAWSQRGMGPGDDARILLMTTNDGGQTWTAPAAVDNPLQRGHQFMPTMTYGAGKLMVVYYDMRDDNTVGVYTSLGGGQYKENREMAGDLASLPSLPDRVFNKFIVDAGLTRRHTVDVRGAQADPADQPVFTSVRMSQYIFGSRAGSNKIEQLQINPPNLPLFRQGSAPFIGDYLDVAASPAFVAGDKPGSWVFNTGTANPALFHAAWTDNRDVRPPADGNWGNYTPPRSDSTSAISVYDPAQPAPACLTGQAGMRNQNVYTARVTQGLTIGTPSNSKPLSATQRAFVVLVQNSTTLVKYYRLKIANQPPGGKATFSQFPILGGADPLDVLDISIQPFSSVARAVFATSTDMRASVQVSVAELAGENSADLLDGGLQGNVLLNADPTNPVNPNLTQTEMYNPDIANPDIANKPIANPDIANPDIANPDIANPDIANPDIANPDIANPDIANPDIANPDIANPDIANPDIANGSLTDATWKITNKGNTTASYCVNLLLDGVLPDAIKRQLIVHRTYSTPVINGCTVGTQRQTSLVTNIINPQFASKQTINAAIHGTQVKANGEVFATAEGAAATLVSCSNATISLGPGEVANITLRFYNPDRTQPLPIVPQQSVTAVTTSQAVNTADTKSSNPTPQVAASKLIIFTTALPGAASGQPYRAGISVVGGTAPYSMTLTNGALPPGLVFDSATGVISGAPTGRGGAFSFVFNITDSSDPKQSAAQPLSITVTKLSVALTAVAAVGSQPTAVRPGDSIRVTATVVNTGQRAFVSMENLAPQSTGTASAVCGLPAPTSSAVEANSSLTVTYACTSITGSGTVKFSVAGSAVDFATNARALFASLTTNAITVVGDAPKITAAARVAGKPYTGGWTNSGVVVTFTCTSGGTADGIAQVTPPVTVTSEGADQSVAGSCTDLVGQQASTTFKGISIDRSKPVLKLQATAGGRPYNGGATNQDVTIAFTCADEATGSGVADVTPGLTLTDAVKRTVTGTCTDKAGNIATVSLANVTVVKHPPALTASAVSDSRDYAAGTWTNKPVVVTFTCTPANPLTVASITPAVTLSRDGTGQTASGDCTDSAGNRAATATLSGINIDQKPPVMALTAFTPPNAEGWNNRDVTAAWSCSDALSGPVETLLSQTLSGEGAGQTLAKTCRDRAGNESQPMARGGINIDKTPPVLVLTALPPANAAGWNNTDVTVTYSCTDAVSGVSKVSPTQTLATETAGTDLPGSCTDRAGNSRVVQLTRPVKIDKTAPAIRLTSRPAANPSGWYNAAVDLTWSCTDTLSGAVAPVIAQRFTASGTGQSATARCLDAAGNSASDTQTGINIDTAAPVLSGAATTAPNASGWYTGNVTVQFTCTDAGSGVDTFTQPVTLTAEGAAQSVPGSCTDKAGNTANVSVSGINIDRTKPAIALTSRPAANAKGWYKSAVTLVWACTDAGSGVVSPTVTQTLSSDGVGQPATATCTDRAGNSVSDTQTGISIDSTAPVLTGAATSAPNASGWYTGNVTVQFTCTDAGSGVDTFTQPVTLIAEGAAQSVSGSCTDKSGNTANVSVSGISINRTKPAIALTSRPAANAKGWHKSAVTLVWACTDAGSGVVSPTVTQTLAGDGAGQSATATCTDRAGNSVSDTQTGISIDTTPPLLSGSLVPAANAAGWNNSNVTVAFSCNDALSGVDTATPGSVIAAETAETAGTAVSGTCTDNAGNTASRTLGTVKLDKSAPTLTLSSRPAANANGWYKSPVSLGWTCVDGLSGALTPAITRTLSGDGAAQSATATCTDAAGNAASDTQTGINIDKTPPTSEIQSPVNGTTFALNAAVPAVYRCADALSGIASCVGSLPILTNLDTSKAGSFTFTLTATDVAGNVTTVTSAYTVQ